MVIEYQKAYGVQVARRDRFNGNPSWMQTVIRQYELGPLGPRHFCESTTCDCVACGRYRWLQKGKCGCKLHLYWGKSTGLEEAMRHKWLACRCTPSLGNFSHESSCQCILELTTQEPDDTPESSYSLPSEFNGSEGYGSGSESEYRRRCIAEIERTMKTIDEEGGLQQTSGDSDSMATVNLVKTYVVATLPNGSEKGIALGRVGDDSNDDDTEDTEISLCNKRRKLYRPDP